jgi:hypothetical protein
MNRYPRLAAVLLLLAALAAAGCQGHAAAAEVAAGQVARLN